MSLLIADVLLHAKWAKFWVSKLKRWIGYLLLSARGNTATKTTRWIAVFTTPGLISIIHACANILNYAKRCRTCRAIWASILGAWLSARGNSIPWCRWNLRRCRG